MISICRKLLFFFLENCGSIYFITYWLAMTDPAFFRVFHWNCCGIAPSSRDDVTGTFFDDTIIFISVFKANIEYPGQQKKKSEFFWIFLGNMRKYWWRIETVIIICIFNSLQLATAAIKSTLTAHFVVVNSISFLQSEFYQNISRTYFECTIGIRNLIRCTMNIQYNKSNLVHCLRLEFVWVQFKHSIYDRRWSSSWI